MFLIEKQKTYTKKVCPNGHTQGSLELAALIDDYKYCPECGAELEKETVPYVVYYCSHCNSKVSKNVSYCPYCGEKKEEKQEARTAKGDNHAS